MYLSLAYITKRYLKYQNIHILLFHLRAIFSETGYDLQNSDIFAYRQNCYNYIKFLNIMLNKGNTHLNVSFIGCLDFHIYVCTLVFKY